MVPLPPGQVEKVTAGQDFQLRLLEVLLTLCLHHVLSTAFFHIDYILNVLHPKIPRLHVRCLQVQRPCRRPHREHFIIVQILTQFVLPKHFRGRNPWNHLDNIFSGQSPYLGRGFVSFLTPDHIQIVLVKINPAVVGLAPPPVLDKGSACMNFF